MPTCLDRLARRQVDLAHKEMGVRREEKSPVRRSCSKRRRARPSELDRADLVAPSSSRCALHAPAHCSSQGLSRSCPRHSLCTHGLRLEMPPSTHTCQSGTQCALCKPSTDPEEIRRGGGAWREQKIWEGKGVHAVWQRKTRAIWPAASICSLMSLWPL